MGTRKVEFRIKAKDLGALQNTVTVSSGFASAAPGSHGVHRGSQISDGHEFAKSLCEAYH